MRVELKDELVNTEPGRNRGTTQRSTAHIPGEHTAAVVREQQFELLRLRERQEVTPNERLAFQILRFVEDADVAANRLGGALIVSCTIESKRDRIRASQPSTTSKLRVDARKDQRDSRAQTKTMPGKGTDTSLQRFAARTSDDDDTDASQCAVLNGRVHFRARRILDAHDAQEGQA
jgi:hypothetical protein